MHFYRKISLLFFSFLVSFVFPASSMAQVSDGMVGWWRFDEGSGSVATDLSGGGYDGTIVGASWVDDDVMGPVLDFGVGDYVNIPAGVFSSVSDQISIALWQYGDAAVQPQNDSIFYGENSGGKRVLNVHLPWGDGRVIYDAGNSNGTYDRIISSALGYDYRGRWNQWVFTKDAAAGEMKIYLNGKLWLNENGKTRPMNEITRFKIGSTADGTNNYDGMICEFRIYNKVLTASEVFELTGNFIAKEPRPRDRAFDLDFHQTLSWTPGPKVSSTWGHDLYFGTSAELVKNRDDSVYMGRLDANSFSLEKLRMATTYYWAVDEVNDLNPQSPWEGQLWQFSTRNNQTEGFYKDLFVHGGYGLTSYKSGNIPATRLLGLNCEHVATDSLDLTLKVMVETDDGNWQDDNGVLLYPDNEPRFRCMYVNGGLSSSAGNGLGEKGRNRVRNFYWNGGAYTGSCAGSILTQTSTRDCDFKIYPKPTVTSGSGIDIYTDMFIPDGVTPFHNEKFGNNNVFERLPLLDYYPELFSDQKIHGIWHYN